MWNNSGSLRNLRWLAIVLLMGFEIVVPADTRAATCACYSNIQGVRYCQLFDDTSARSCDFSCQQLSAGSTYAFTAEDDPALAADCSSHRKISDGPPVQTEGSGSPCACYATINNQVHCTLLSEPSSDSCNTQCLALGGQNSTFASSGGVATADELSQDCRRYSPVPANAATTVQPTSYQPPPRPYLTPNLSVEIPGLKFSPITETDKEITVGFLADYIGGVYNFLLGFAVTVAIVMLMIGGFQYVMFAGSSEIGAAKERIKNAIVGLVLLLAVYLLLNIVNPRLTLLQPLTVQKIEPIPSETEPDSVDGKVATKFRAPKGTNISGKAVSLVPEDLTDKIEHAAQELAKDNKGMIIASGLRTIEEQKSLIARNCQNPPGGATCNPKERRPPTCILKDNDPKNCPHTTGRALDIWGSENKDGRSVQCISQENCLKNKTACFANDCQAALIKAMKAQGFCVLSSEPWHFEQPKMSPNCR